MYTYKYPRPAVAADCVVFGFDGKQIYVLLIERGVDPFKGHWALPGGFLKENESIDECARRELLEETNLKAEYMEQLHVFSKPARDPRTRVISVAYYAFVRKNDFKILAGDDAAKASWFELNTLHDLAFDHKDIIDMAWRTLREVIHTRPLVFKLLDKNFSMGELQRACELISGRTYDRRNFARKMTSSGIVECQTPTPSAAKKSTRYTLAKENFDNDDFWKPNF